MPNLNVRYMEDFYHGEMGGGIPQKLFLSCVESQKKWDRRRERSTPRIRSNKHSQERWRVRRDSFGMADTIFGRSDSCHHRRDSIACSGIVRPMQPLWTTVIHQKLARTLRECRTPRPPMTQHVHELHLRGPQCTMGKIEHTSFIRKNYTGQGYPHCVHIPYE